MAGTLVLRRGTSLFASLMQLAQAALSIILVALAAPYLPADSESTSCALSTSWQKSWHQHSVVIREIQDQLGCCGYRSLKDRAWPFPTGTKPDPLQCAKQFHRKISCAGPWNEELRRKVGVTLGIGVVVAVLQVLDPLFRKLPLTRVNLSANSSIPAFLAFFLPKLANFLYGSSTLWSERLFQSNPFDWVKRRQNQSDNATFTRRLLTGGDEEETRVESYHDFEDSAARQNHSSTESGDNARPRVEPTIHGAHESHESSAWRQN